MLTYIGYSHRKMGDVDVGIGFYKQALAIDPNNLNTREYPRREKAMRAPAASRRRRPNSSRWKSSAASAGCEQYDDLASFIATGHE